MTPGHGHQHRRRFAQQSHLLGPSLTWQERGGAYPAARRTRGRRARNPPLWWRPRSPGGTWVSQSLGCTDRRTVPGCSLAPSPARDTRFPRSHRTERVPGRPTPLVRPPPGSRWRDCAPPSLTYLVAEFEKRHGGRRRSATARGRRVGRWPASLRRARAGGGAASPAARRREEPRRSRLLHRGLPPSFFFPFSLSLSRPPPHAAAAFAVASHPLPEIPRQPPPPRRSSPRQRRHPNSTPQYYHHRPPRLAAARGRGQSKPSAYWLRRRARSRPGPASPVREGRGTGSGDAPSGRAWWRGSGRAPRARWAEPGREVGEEPKPGLE